MNGRDVAEFLRKLSEQFSDYRAAILEKAAEIVARNSRN